MAGKIKYLISIIIVIAFCSCASLSSIKTFFFGIEKDYPLEYQDMIDKKQFADIFSPDVINSYHAERMMFAITTDSAGFTDMLIKAIGRNYRIGQILIDLDTGKIYGGLVGNAYYKIGYAIQRTLRTKEKIIFWDDKGRAIEVEPYTSPGANCLMLSIKKWKNGKVISHKFPRYYKK